MAITTSSPSNNALFIVLIAIIVALAAYAIVRMTDNTETISINTPAGRIEANVPSN